MPELHLTLRDELVLFFLFYSHVHKRSFSVRPDLEQRQIMGDY